MYFGKSINQEDLNGILAHIVDEIASEALGALDKLENGEAEG